MRTTYVYLTGTRTLRIRIDVQQDTYSLQLSRLAIQQGLEEFEAFGAVVRRIDFLINRESCTIYANDVLQDVDFDRRLSGSIRARPVFDAVKRVTIDLRHYPSLRGTEWSTLREASDEIRHLLWDWDHRSILTFLYPMWYSNPEPTLGEMDGADSETGIDDWDVWADV